MNDEQRLRDLVAETHDDPLAHAYLVYPWGTGELKDSTGPRKWQRDVLGSIRDHLRNPETRYQPFLGAVASGHGIGKSALISQVIKWGMDTCRDCKVVVTANTEGQLRTKTWPEVGKWQRLAINKHWFQVTATSVYSADPEHETSWRANAVPWSESNTEAFQGLHNVGRRIIVICDEASAIADKIWEVTEGALTDEKTEIIWLAFGNPTRNTGRFRECFRRFRHRWKTWHIDSRDVEGTNKELFAKWAEDYGEDSDFFKVRVRGIFPSQSVKQFIAEPVVDAAYGRYLAPGSYDWAPKILTLDNAWEGDDHGAIGLRQGLSFRILKTFPKNDNDVVIANMLARLEDEHQAAAVFIDGGYGTGVVSVGRTLDRNWILVWFGGESSDPACLNKRAEMWNATKKWLAEGGSIEKRPSLRDELLSVETVPRMDGKIQLESKESMKKRGLPSPNEADCLALSFAHPVQNDHVEFERREILEGHRRIKQRGRGVAYNPYSDDRMDRLRGRR